MVKGKVTKPVKKATKSKQSAAMISKVKDDFVMTLDSDGEDLEEESADEKEEVEEKPVKLTKKQKKQKLSEADEELLEREKQAAKAGINPDFQFSLDGFAATSEGLDGWNFEVSKDDNKVQKREVDLDSIIKRKGGLLDEDEDEDEAETDVKMEENEDDLAIDGFGGGVQPGKDMDEPEDEDEENKEEVENEEEEDSDGSDSEAEECMHPDDLVLDDHKGPAIDEGPQDTAEEMAAFYAPEEENNDKTESVHKTFQTLNLSRPVMKGISALGYQAPTPIQSRTIPIALMGKDLVAGAVTGSGKTAAYIIPVLERLLYKSSKVAATKVVVLTPTRELSIQVADVGKKLAQYVSGVRFGLAVGGLNLRVQEQELKTRPEVVIATPGRFIDHVRNSPSFNVDDVEILVIDEADRMLEEGFQQELTEILTLLPKKRQTLLFSATMNSSISSLIQLSLSRPVRVMINPPKQAASGLVQEFVRIRKRDHLKPALLASILKKMDKEQRTIIFVARKETAHRLRIMLGLLGVRIGELHGALSQEQRLQSITAFKKLEVPILVCTDLASRGLDIPKIECVVNYDMPQTHAVYLHRVGRTARAGREGRSITLVGEAAADRAIVREAIKSVSESKQGKAVGRNVDWPEVEKLYSKIEEKGDIVNEILAEEKEEKAMLQAEMEVRKGENLLKYEKEIASRPRRTWFQNAQEKKADETSDKRNLLASNKDKMKKKKDNEEVRMYKKTKTDRKEASKRGKPKGKGKRK
ncbi:ATP-dependent RNA helicase DRS1 [Yarrowia lipolytica]|jgi:ATP-dependent RNA helicase DDX27|uniref:ATP-dependent RNA helicase DRS1 n=3 Tax=Yarrowia lipolytica TaxID=4952 RepID=DRS1_YARLI|nr:YALI0B16896p [Yarrowia lipolytica CLIB122]Q6CEB8.1 RecName: Full=ATP-dependent RNA helicase DRS1 [Yarrowia lipolytica CLIB122]KAB8285051.1 ATP-dependent RNA helicase DRS1 [Yarrowia lipolytica]KAE8175025.1 ATP-dependent RNA helicase DRS1 [Yarrowia lipolytica]KAJ8052606.1 ATP-dependent RNA helicase DRS1 [Yarrowia lipolytica]QNP97092.1 ATP-dependent RNA helicase DRS1 [Yarrowia lipolytica]RDW28354.1 ATP-dependent RNA helicase DRS1 [Yarrowia lipolytica]|eukprot:XP_500994.1 YALI0B16896p [Yarrowia lipolytica CLIB122]